MSSQKKSVNGDEAIVGGTFDTLHDGHEALLTTAFQNANFVTVGVLSEAALKRLEKETENSYIERKEKIEEVCATLANVFDTIYTVNSVDNPHAGAVESSADIIVVPPNHSARNRTAEINRRRVLNGDTPLQVFVAPTVTDVHGDEITSERIQNNEIDTHGNPLAVVDV